MAGRHTLGLGSGIAAAVAVAVFFALLVFDAQIDSGMDMAMPADNSQGEPAEQALVLIPSLDQMMAMQAGDTSETLPAQAVTARTFLANASPALGDSAAPITLVEFGDYQCHFCNVFFHDTKDLIVKNYVEQGSVKMIFKDYHIIGPDSVDASHAAHCAGDQGMFWEYHYMLYDNWAGENTGWASRENLAVLASEMPHLDYGMWLECLDDESHSALIHQSNEDAKALGLTGTPSFFVLGPDGHVDVIIGAEPYAVFARTIDAAIAGGSGK